MSMLHTAAPYRRDDRAAFRVPVVMPTVQVTIDGEGRLDVLLDQEPYSSDRALQRSDLKRVLDEMAAELGTPIRVEVHEPDGATFTDIVVPGRTGGEPAPEPPTASRCRAAMSSAFGITGEGFVAGEEVAVAVVVAHQVAGQDGSAQLHLPPAVLAAQRGVVLVGRTSGALAVSEGGVS